MEAQESKKPKIPQKVVLAVLHSKMMKLIDEASRHVSPIQIIGMLEFVKQDVFQMCEDMMDSAEEESIDKITKQMDEVLKEHNISIN